MSWESLLPYIRDILSVKLFEIGGTVINPLSIIVFLLIITITYIVSKVMQRGMRRMYGKMQLKKEGTATALNRLVHYVVLLVAVGRARQAS